MIFVRFRIAIFRARQVIGLRQYGQKDPLSEFKEAFVLFGYC